MTIAASPIARTLPEIVEGFRDRAGGATVQSARQAFDEDLNLVVLLLDNGEQTTALRSLCSALSHATVTVQRSEYVELAREASRLALLDDEWAAVERLVQD